MYKLPIDQRNKVLKYILSDEYKEVDNLLVPILAQFDAVKTTKSLVDYFSICEGGNSWVSDKALEFMQAVLFPVVIMRDLEVLVPASAIGSITSMSDLEKADHVTLDMDVLKLYLNANVMVDLAYAFKSLLKDKSFVKRLNDSVHGGWFNYEGTYLQLLLSALENHGLDCSDENKKPTLDDWDKDCMKQFNYGINPWLWVIEKFT